MAFPPLFFTPPECDATCWPQNCLVSPQNPFFGPISPFLPLPQHYPTFCSPNCIISPQNISFRACPSPSGYHPNFQPQNLLISHKKSPFLGLAALFVPTRSDPNFLAPKQPRFAPKHKQLNPSFSLIPKFLFSPQNSPKPPKFPFFTQSPSQALNSPSRDYSGGEWAVLVLLVTHPPYTGHTGATTPSHSCAPPSAHFWVILSCFPLIYLTPSPSQ